MEFAIANSPASVQQQAEDARVGRAVVEWVRVNPYATPRRMEDDSQFGYAGAVEEIKAVIAKAKEGKQA